MCKAKKLTLETCRTADDFLAYAEYHGGKIESGHGSHKKVRGPSNGIAVVPCHGGDIPNGTRKSIVRQLAAILSILAVIASIITYL